MSVKLSLIIFYLSVSPSVIKKYYYQWIYKQKKLAKKNLLTSFYRYFPREACHITDRNIVSNFVGDYLKILFKIYLIELKNN